MNLTVCSFISLLFLNYVSSELRRSKRVINGEPLQGRPTTYKAIRYYGVIGTAHYVMWMPMKFGIWDRFGRGVISCSGVLLSPIIFQTACHCLATFDTESSELINPAKVVQGWENRDVVYFGVSKRFGDTGAMSIYTPVLTEKFIVHGKCGKIKDTTLITHDFGLIQLDRDWFYVPSIERVYPWTEIDFAPVKTLQELLYFENYALGMELVCLVIGYGGYRRANDPPHVSNVLRHGWEILLPLPRCIYSTAHWIGYLEYPENTRSWICTENFTLHLQEPGLLDAGGPLTCNNQFIAIVSGEVFKVSDEAYTNTKNFKDLWKVLKMFPYEERYDIVSLYSALSFDPYSSSVDYRKSLEYVFYRLPETYTEPPVTNNARELKSREW